MRANHKAEERQGSLTLECQGETASVYQDAQYPKWSMNYQGWMKVHPRECHSDRDRWYHQQQWLSWAVAGRTHTLKPK